MADASQEDALAPVPADTISIDPAVAFRGGVFTISGNVTSAAVISKVEISASVDGAPVQVLGNAAVNPDGSFTYADTIGPHTQTSITATIYDTIGGTASAPATYQLKQSSTSQNTGIQTRFSPNDTAQANPTSQFVFGPLGHETVTVFAPNQTFYSVNNDLFHNVGQKGTTFVFGQNYVFDAITDFVPGTGHDFISLPGQDFGFSKANVFQNTRDDGNGSVLIVDPVTKDTIQLAGLSKVQLVTNPADIILRPICFCSHTRVRTPRGEVAIEDLVVGDLVTTTACAERPVRWLGHRSMDIRRSLNPQDIWPIRIGAHAFGEGCPARDLFVSPGHAICVDVLGEVLIPAIALVNGSSVRQVEVYEVTYWHVELDSHDVILADNLPCESYLDMGNRSFFVEEGVVSLAASPDAADPAARTHADFCRPFHAAGPLVEAVRARLAARAKAVASEGRFPRSDAA